MSEGAHDPAARGTDTRGAGRRALLGTVLALALGAALALLGMSRVWGRAELTGGVTEGLTDAGVDVRGSDLLPVVPALALVALAALVAVPATRRIGRRVIGGVVAAAGLAVAGSSLATAVDLRRQVVRWVQAGSSTGSVDTVEPVALWPALVVAAGVVLVAAGLAVVVAGPRWPGMGSRYERPAAGARSTAVGSPSGATEEPVDGAGPADAGAPDDSSDRGTDGRRPVETWDALDRGEDPTT